MKKFLFFAHFFVFMLVAHSSFAQLFGNEWINAAQPYYKIRVAQQGMVRLWQPQLLGVGFAPGTNPKNMHLYLNGVEVPMYVHGEADNAFNNTDYIEFFGSPNSGSTDAGLYASPADQPHQYKSLITDTATYFLTHNSTPGLRFVASNTASLSGISEPYYMHEELQLLSGSYYTNELVGGRVTHSDYMPGEHYLSSPNFTKGSNFNYAINSPYSYQGTAPAPSIQILGYGSSQTWIPNNLHAPKFYVGASTSSLSLILDTTFANYAKITVNKPLTIAQIGAATTAVSIQSVPANGTVETSNYHYIKLKYPRSFELNGSSSKLLDINSTSAAKRIEFGNYNAAKNTAYIYNLTTNKRIRANLSANNCAAMLDANGKIYLTDSTDAIAPIDVQPLTFNNINTAANYDFILLTHNKLLTAAQTYANYRRTSQGGNYNVLVITTSTLYDQFAYGVFNHPLAVKNFMRYLAAQQANPPQHLFLVGKGYNTKDLRLVSRCFSNNLVPTWGDIGSDNMLTALVTNTSVNAPGISTGRFSATNPQQVLDYLAKIQAYETAPSGAWQKKIITTTGARSINDRTNFRNYLNQMSQHFTGSKLGADTVNFDKSYGNEPTQVISKNFILDKFNQGAIMYTYFGHGTYGYIDIDEGRASEYPDKLATGQFPFLYYNGCNIGNAFGDYVSRGETLVAEPRRCGIGLLSQSTLGFEYYLVKMGLIFSRRFSNDDYGQPIGEIAKRTANEMSITSEYDIVQVQQSVLQCDPALRMRTFASPELTVSFDAVQPAYNAYGDSISLKITIQNLGSTAPDSIPYRIVRTLPDGTTQVYDFKSKKVAQKNSLTISVPNTNKCCVAGNNSFLVIVDNTNQIAESNESNNAANYTLNIANGATVAVLPVNQSIVATSAVQLVAQSTNLRASPEVYTFEIDTTINFNSSQKITTTASSINATATATVNLALNNTAYFWRVKTASEATWQQNNFTYSNGATAGWQQNSFEQFKTLSTSFITLDAANKKFGFGNNYYFISNNTDAYSSSGIYASGIRNNFTLMSGGYMCGANLRLSHIKNNTLNITKFTDCVANREAIAIFVSTPAGRQSLKTILDTIPAGDYIAVQTTLGSAEYLKYDNLLPSLAAYGVDTTSLRNLSPTSTGNSLAFVAQKGNPSYISQALVNSPSSSQDVSALSQNHVKGLWHRGTLTTQRVGPGTNWISFQCSFLPSTDSVLITISGINTSGFEVVLVNQQLSNTINLAAVPNINNYRYLKVKAQLFNYRTRMAPQLQKWSINYTPTAETTLVFDATYSPVADTMYSGGVIQQSIKIKNLSPATPPALLQYYYIKNSSGAVVHFMGGSFINLSAAGTASDQMVVVLNQSINNLPAGNYTLVTSFLPNDQSLEQSKANNVFCKSFYIKGSPLPIKVLLQGCYNTSTALMNDNLRSLGVLPATEQYTNMLAVPVSNNYAIVQPNVLAQTGNNAIVDWVMVRLRSKTNPAVVVKSYVGLLQRDGDLVSSDDGISPIVFGVEIDQYYVEVRHRNHLNIMTATPISLQSTGNSILDFTNPNTLTYGMNAQNTVGGKNVLISGNANQDKQVNATDFNAKWLPQNGQTYNYFTQQADFNLDGQVNSSDFNTQWLPNNSKQSRVP